MQYIIFNLLVGSNLNQSVYHKTLLKYLLLKFCNLKICLSHYNVNVIQKTLTVAINSPFKQKQNTYYSSGR